MKEFEVATTHLREALKGKKYDQGKPPMALLPPEAMNEIARVLGFGANKYGNHNWRNGLDWTRISSAVLRHLSAWHAGEDLDPESGLSHLAHAGCGIMFLIAYEQNKIGKDDRYKHGG